MPIDQSYWVVPDLFLAGGYPLRDGGEQPETALKRLLDLGFSTFIDLTSPDDLLPEYGAAVQLLSENRGNRLSFPIPNGSIPHTREQMVEILDAIDRSLTMGKAVYLHCYCGAGRVSLVVGCWLQRHFEGEIFHQMVPRHWSDLVAPPRENWNNRCLPETDEQKRYIEEWSEPDRISAQMRRSTPWLLSLPTPFDGHNLSTHALNRELHLAAKEGKWEAMLRGLNRFPAQVNHPHYDDDDCYLPLHLAALNGAPPAVISRMIELGAFRTLRCCRGKTAYEIAAEQGHSELLSLLQPQQYHPISQCNLDKMTGYFHDFVRRWVTGEGEESRVLKWQPLDPLTELENPILWAPLPALRGELRVELRRAGQRPQVMLICTARVTPDGGVTALMTPDGVVQLESGSV